MESSLFSKCVLFNQPLLLGQSGALFLFRPSLFLLGMHTNSSTETLKGTFDDT